MTAMEEEVRMLKEKLGIYEKQQQDLMGQMKSEVTGEVAKVAGGLRELYQQVSDAIGKLASRVEALEVGRSAEREKPRRSLVELKDMKPEVLSKDEDWKRWKSEIEDYCSEAFDGMKDILEKVREAEEEVDETWFGPEHEDWWQKGEMLCRFLKRFTEGEAKRVVKGVSDDNGWEAWRKLHQQFEPGMVVREAQVMARYTGMVNRRAKTPKETKALMVELADRAKRVEEVTGRAVEDRHAMSVITGILDPETLKYTAQFQGAKASVELLKKKVMEFTNLMTSQVSKDAMDIGRCEQIEEMNEEQGEEGRYIEEINGVGERCYNCGGFGHYARECQAKGKGKGKDKGKGKGKDSWFGKGYPAGKGWEKGALGGKGWEKGKGKSKGKEGGNRPRFGKCWTCGGDHFAKDCQQGGGREENWAGAGQAGVRSLCSVRHVKQTVEARAPRQEEEPVMTEGDFKLVRSKKTRQKEKKEKDKQVRSLVERVPEAVNLVEEHDEWEEIDMAVDSGATETVVGEGMLKNIEVVEGEAYKKGVQYEVASGELIPNLGEKRFVAVGERGETRRMKAQVCDVNKALLSVKRMMQAGNRVVFDPEGSYVEDTYTGERMNLREDGGMFMLKLWVQRPFARQAER